MARRELKPWHYQVTTALALVTLFVVIAFFAQTFRTFFLTDHDPVLIAVERVKEKVEKKVEKDARATKEAEQDGGEATKQTVD
jgi:hypothetical protein